MTWLFQRSLSRLLRDVVTLSADVESQLTRSVKAFTTTNASLAAEAIEADKEIDQQEVDIEEECLKILALYQPVASDLRFVVAVLKIISDLERIGDQSVNIAERTSRLNGERPPEGFQLEAMSEKVADMLALALDSLVDRDAVKARSVLNLDDAIDALNREHYELMIKRLRNDEGEVERLMGCVSVSRALERIADHATNIAEDVQYMVEGEIVRHQIRNQTRSATESAK